MDNMVKALRRWAAVGPVAAGLLWLLILSAPLESQAQEPVGSQTDWPLDVNTATLEELQFLPGIGPSKAAAIIEYRDREGPFRRMADLAEVPGIGATTLENIRPLVTLGEWEEEGEEPAAEAPTLPVNVNTADLETLQLLPGIGPVKAAAIIDYRTRQGRFRIVEDLQNVHGIGPVTLENIRPWVVLE